MPKRSSTKTPNAAAVALGRLGGLKGGVARAAALSPDERSRIARAAASIRWKKKPPIEAAEAAKDSLMSSQMTQMEFPVIPHALEGKLIQQRASDGYLNATAMCDAAGKQMSHYIALKSTKEFIAELAADTKIPADMLIITIQGGKPELQGTWIHPQVAISLGQWLSPKFAVQVAKWVYEWMAGGTLETKAKLPAHIQRYMVNRMEIPPTHFSMLNEMTFGLIAPLEVQGYTIPEALMPDISQGRMFSDWLRKAKGIEPKTFPTYKHQFLDGRPTVDARLYPNELLAEFRKHLNEVWIPTRMESYFKERDPKALPFLPKLLALSAPK